MSHLPPVSSDEYEMYIELSEDRQQWRRAPTSPIPDEIEETYLVEIETDQFFRIITKNKSTTKLKAVGWVEGKLICKYTSRSKGRLVLFGESYIADGFVRGNVLQDFKFTSTPVSEVTASTEEALDSIGKIEMELTKVMSLIWRASSSLSDVSTNDLNDSNVIRNESMKKRYGTNVGGRDTKLVPSRLQLWKISEVSLTKKVIFICRDKLGCIAERKERGMPLPEVEAPLTAASSSDNNNNNKKRTRESSDNGILVIDAEDSAPSDQSPGKKMKLEKKSAATTTSSNNMSSWNAEKVSAWIAELDPKFKALSYDKLFLENDVDGAALQCLNNEMLGQMGIKPMGHRAKILGAVNKQQGASGSAASSATPQVIVIE